MNLKSLALKTDLIFTKHNGEILDRNHYLVVRTHSNPNFFWGNLLIFEKAPMKRDLSKWINLFDQEFPDPRIYHKTFAWDSEEVGEISEFQEAGFQFEKNIVLVATEDQITLPERLNKRIDMAIIQDKDWAKVVQLQAATNPNYASFYAKQALSYQEMIKKGLGIWFGAYLDGELAGSLGIFKEGSVGRFQVVSTHPDFQRQGVCSSLVYKAALFAFSQMGVQKLVMVADEDYHAAKIYESVGFRPTEKVYGVCWFDNLKPL